jgi:hypothetical protein
LEREIRFLLFARTLSAITATFVRGLLKNHRDLLPLKRCVHFQNVSFLTLTDAGQGMIFGSQSIHIFLLGVSRPLYQPFELHNLPVFVPNAVLQFSDTLQRGIRSHTSASILLLQVAHFTPPVFLTSLQQFLC